MSFKHVADLVPTFLQLPTIDEMQVRTVALQALNHPLVSIRKIGHSRNGEPIELISIGRGRGQALLVGTPHPNEPIGCLTIEFLIDRFLTDQKLREELDFTWHFIKSIEPDGLRLNEGWLKRPLNPEAYLQDFFRPALDEQADYTFPLVIPGYSFTSSSPENVAWQEAIRIVRPDLLVSLHNAEHGGVFYFVTRNLSDLTAELAEQPGRYSMPLDEVGEPFAETVPLLPGVFLAPDMVALVSHDSAPRSYHAGNSSFGYTKDMGTFGLAIETPYWRETGPPSSNMTMTLAAILDPARQWAEDSVRLIATHLPRLKNIAQGNEIRFARAIEDMQAQIERQRFIWQQLPAVVLPASVGRAQQRMVRMVHLRPIAMLRRLASKISTRRGDPELLSDSAEAQTRQYLHKALAEPMLSSGMERVPLKTSVSIQVDAILTSASMLNVEARSKS
jgi:Zinc carboxypeptidase